MTKFFLVFNGANIFNTSSKDFGNKLKAASASFISKTTILCEANLLSAIYKNSSTWLRLFRNDVSRNGISLLTI